MMRPPMRCKVLRWVLAVACFTAVPARADVLTRVFQQVADPSGPGAAPPASDDLTQWAGPARATSLPELLAVAVKQAPALATATIDIEIAEARIYQTLARDDWRIDGSLNVQRQQGGFFGGQELDHTTTLSASAGIGRAFSTGGTLGVRAGTNFFSRTLEDATANEFLGGENWTHDLSATFTQPMLRNRGRFFWEANERRASLSRDASVLARRLAAIQTVQTVVSAYWDLVLAERQVAITRASLDLARERLRITQIGTDGGKIPRSELPAVQQIIATREEEVLSGELAVLDRSIALRRAAGMPIGKGELGLRLGAELVTRDVTWDLGELTERAFQASPELAQLAKQDAVAVLDVEITENGLLPQLDAALTVGTLGADTKAGAALENLVTLDSLLVSGTLTLQHSLGQENVRGAAREQRATRRRIEVTAFDVRAQIAQTMARAVAQLELARRRVALSQRAIDLAKQNIQIETDRFNLGRATNFDVLSRQEELRLAELRQAQAMIDWHKAETVVQALTGDLLPQYGIELGPKR